MFNTTTVLIVLAATLGQTEENKLPPEVRKELEFLVGTWEVEDNFGETTEKSRYTAQWTRGQDSLFLTYSRPGLSGVGISGWDPQTKEIVETWYSPSAGQLVHRFKPVAKNVWEGSSRMVSPEGVVEEGKIRLEKTGANSFTFTRSTPEKEERSVNQRVPVRAPASKEKLRDFEFFIGDWKTQRDDGGVATWSFHWGHNKTLIENKLQSRNEAGEIVLSHTGFIIWDAAIRRLVNECVTADGNRVDFLWEKGKDGEWFTWIRNASGEGGVVKILDDNSWTLTWENTTRTYIRQ